MEDLTTLDQVTLMEKLVKHTNEYLGMLRTGVLLDEYAECKQCINNIIAEIRRRDQNEEKDTFSASG